MESHLDRDEMHFLLDRIPDSDIATARKTLRALADPVELALLNAPPDDEPPHGTPTSAAGMRAHHRFRMRNS